MTRETKEDLSERVRLFNILQLPGQSPMMDMGTAYLINDLHREVKKLRTEIVRKDEAIASFRSAIQSGEEWSAFHESIYAQAMKKKDSSIKKPGD